MNFLAGEPMRLLDLRELEVFAFPRRGGDRDGD